MTNSKETFLTLVKLGAGTLKEASLPDDVNWEEVRELASKQNLLGLALDGIGKLPESQRPPRVIFVKWIGTVMRDYESRYKKYTEAIAELAGFYNSHGFKMMVLKGYACSLDWPVPNHRPSGDIDIWLFGRYKEADSLLSQEKRIVIDRSHHHHTVFNWKRFSVENHYDFISIYHHRSHLKYEKILKGLGQDDSCYTQIDGYRVYLPSANLHALFLLKHQMLHFVSGGINMRQLLDWAFFVQKHYLVIDWGYLTEILDEFGMTPAFNVFNAICIDDLGFSEEIFPLPVYDKGIKERVLNDILFPEFPKDIPKQFFRRIIWKWRRWTSASWKHKLCYKESMFSAFIVGLWGHIIKPSSI